MKMKGAFLQFAGINLREIRETDLEVIGQWINDEDITKNMVMGCVPGSSPIYCGWNDVYSDYKNLKESKVDIAFAMCLIPAAKPLGIVGLYDINWIARNAEFRIIIGDRSYLEKGIGTLVTRGVIRYAFEKLNLHKVYLGANAEDERANKCYQKVGFVKEGTIRDYNYRNGRYYNANIYSILEDEICQE